MKIKKYIIPLILVIVFLATCSTSGGVKKSSSNKNELDISAQGAIGRLETAVSGPMYTGDGGRNIRLAVLAPDVQGDVQGYLPLYIQGLLNNNINKYSAINLIDRQNLEKIISEQNLTASGRFSDNDFISIGKLTNAQYFLFGTIQRLSGNRYSLQLSITEASTGVRKATVMKEGALTQFEGRAILLNEATAELLRQMEVQLTEIGMQTLMAGNISTVQSQAGLARGISAQADGSEVEALFNFAQAISFDSSQLEALTRLNMLSTTISGGTISQQITNDIQARDRWIESFKEATRFFNDHPPFEIIFDPSLIQIGETNFKKRTATLGMRIALDASKAGFDALNTMLDGLEKTGRRNEWGFSGWPFMDISPRERGAILFNGKNSLSYKVDVLLVNENGKTIGKNNITLNTFPINFSSGDTIVPVPFSVDDIVRFPNVKTEDLTPTLTIVIVAVNGISSNNLATTGYLKIETGNLERDDHYGPVLSVSFNSDGKLFISSSYGEVKLWDTATGRLIRTFSVPGLIHSVAFSPDGRQISSGSFGIFGDKTIRLWDIATGREIRTFMGDDDSIGFFITFSPDGRQIFSGSNDGIISWDTTTGRVIRRFSGHNGAHAVAINFDNIRIISGSGLFSDYSIKNWDISTGRTSGTYTGHTGSINSLDFSPDDLRFISGSSDNTIKLWNYLANREIRVFIGHTDSVESVAFSPNGKLIVSGSRDKTIKLWDVETGRLIRTLKENIIGEVSSVCFSPDSRYILSSSYDSTIKIWDVNTGRLIRTIGNAKPFEGW